nr:seipin-1 [Ipomoea batatas]
MQVVDGEPLFHGSQGNDDGDDNNVKCKKQSKGILEQQDELAGAKEARNLSEWFSKLVALQAETVSACLSALSSPLFSRRLFGSERDRTSKKMGVPVGHTFYVSLLLVMPESDYNRELGIFQVAAELISNNGGIVTRSSHPCMLQFRSQPIRLMRELIWGVPLLLGIATETQRIVIPMIRHKEGYPRTEAIRVILMPRASTLALPQVYEAEIILKSHLPWMKEVLYRWKWTFYVWVSMYIYMALLVVSLCCFRSLMVPVLTTTVRGYDEEQLMLEPSDDRVGEERNVPESLKRRRLSSRRKAMLRQKVVAEPAETVDSSASSYTITRDDTAPLQEDTEDSESVCFRSGGEE